MGLAKVLQARFDEGYTSISVFMPSGDLRLGDGQMQDALATARSR